MGEETRSSDIACPAQVDGEVSFPWSEGDRCFEWQSSAEPESLDAVCPEDPPPKGPGAASPCRERLPDREVHTGHEKDGPHPPLARRHDSSTPRLSSDSLQYLTKHTDKEQSCE